MLPGDKSRCTSKQKRQADDIEEAHEKKRMPEGKAVRRAWRL